jgi:hypothetical protein
MRKIHDQFTHQMRNRLKTTGMGLGLVRLLQDAGLTEEARMTLSSLESGFRGVGVSKTPTTKNLKKVVTKPMTTAGFSPHAPWSRSCPSQRQ